MSNTELISSPSPSSSFPENQAFLATQLAKLQEGGVDAVQAHLQSGEIVQTAVIAIKVGEHGLECLGQKVTKIVPFLAPEEDASDETIEYHNKAVGAGALAAGFLALAGGLMAVAVTFAAKADASKKKE